MEHSPLQPAPVAQSRASSRADQVVRVLILIAAVSFFLWYVFPLSREFQRRMECVKALQEYGRSLHGGASSDPNLLRCPGSGGPYWSGASPAAEAAGREAGGRIIVYEPLMNHHNGGTLLFADGSVEFITGKEKYRAILKAQGLDAGRDPLLDERAADAPADNDSDPRSKASGALAVGVDP